jgi:hypothetical protein
MNIVAVHFLTSEDQEMRETRIKQRAFRVGDKIGGLDCVFYRPASARSKA